jgi:threonyl-tRNA synthetase
LARNDRVTYFGVVGGQEVTDQTIALQAQNGDKVGTFPVDDVIARMLEEIAEKTLPVIAAPATG